MKQTLINSKTKDSITNDGYILNLGGSERQKIYI